MLNLQGFLGKLFGTGKTFAAEVAGEVAGIGVAEKLWGSKFLTRFKPHAEKAYEAIKMSWLGGLTDSAERAFASIVTAYASYLMNYNFLAPWHAQARIDRALTFLNGKDKGQYTAYRRALARDPDQQRRVTVFAQLVQAPTPEAQENAFKSAFREPIGPKIVDLAREYGPRAWEATKSGAQSMDGALRNWIDKEDEKKRGKEAADRSREALDASGDRLRKTLSNGLIPGTFSNLARRFKERKKR